MDHQADCDALFVLMHSSDGYIHLEVCPIKHSRHSRPVPSLHPRLHLEWWTEGLGGDDCDDVDETVMGPKMSGDVRAKKRNA